MESQSTIASFEKNSATVERLLDATKDAVIDHGVRLTTVQDISTRAGVSRMTFYRHFGSVPEAVRLALTREFEQVVTTVSSLTAAGNARERLVQFAVAGVRAYAADPMVLSIVARDPELLMPYLTERFGASQELILAAMAPLLGAGIEDRSVEVSEITATMVLILMQAVAVPAKTLAGRGQLESALEELALILDVFLDPAKRERASGTGAG